MIVHFLVGFAVSTLAFLIGYRSGYASRQREIAWRDEALKEWAETSKQFNADLRKALRIE